MHSFIWPVLLLAGSSYAATDVKISLFAPSNSEPLSSNLLAFSLEQDRWPDWAGKTSRNEFTYNALSNFAKRTGRPPKIRVGANSEDRTRIDNNVDLLEAIYPAHTAISPYPEPTNLTVSDAYYALSKYLPKGTHMTWGLNLGADDTQNAIDMAKSILKTFDNGNQIGNTGIFLDMLELGNEPDLFPKNKMRPTGWTVQEYVADWIEIMTPVVEAVKLAVDGPVSVLGCSFAGTAFTPRGAFDAGLLDSVPGKLITTISQHRYSAAFCAGGDFALASFMSKAAVRSNITIFDDGIDATKEKGLVYILGETNSIACHGAPGVSNTAGAAIWTIDWTLHAASRGIPEVYFHEGIGYKYNFFQPVSLDRSPVDDTPLDPPLAPHLQPGYYAGLVITEAVGTKSGKTKIVELDIEEDNVSGYAIYENGLLARAVIVNLNAWLLSDEGKRERGKTHIDFKFALSNAKTLGKIAVRRLEIGHADDLKGLLWGGQSFETSDLAPVGQKVDDHVLWGDGVDVSETEAVLITF